MGGLCGIVRWQGQGVSRDELGDMVDAALHRGEGRFAVGGDGAFGCASLNHTDGEEAAVLETSRFCLVVHARLDNRAELLQQLNSPPGSSNAHLVLASYHQWGVEAPQHLIGDFAFTIWDREQRQLFAARDPVAMRPFYYYLDPKRFLFASEVKQLLAVPGVPKRLNKTAVAVYLTGPFGDPGWTFYEGVEQLAPGHALLVNANGARSWRYWEANLERRLRFRDEREYIECFKTIFVQAVKDRLDSARPTAIALSGGMDSGCVAATAGWLGNSEVRAYSWAFRGEHLADGDERKTAERVVDPYTIPIIPIFGDDAWPLGDPEGHGPDADDPFMWFSQTLNDRLYESARREGARRLLTGDYGDEVVGDWFYDYLGWLRAGRFGDVARDLSSWHRVSGQSYSSIGKQLLRYRMRQRTGYQPTPAPWVAPELRRHVGLDDVLEQHARKGLPSPSHARHARIFGGSPVMITTFTERRAAKYGLTLAEPWSDRRLIEYVLAIPQWRVQSLSQPKAIAKKAMRGIVPDAALEQITKTLQGAFYDLGMKDKERDRIFDLIDNSVAAEYGLLVPDVVRTAYEHYLEDKPYAYSLWWPLTLELWLRHHWT